MQNGYYRFPTINDRSIAFVCEDDLWTVPVDGGLARRLTAGLGAAVNPLLSPDGKHIAFIGREEGIPEVYIMPAEGGPAQRITFCGAGKIAAWTPGSKAVIFASSYTEAFASEFSLFSVPIEGGSPVKLIYGPAMSIAYGPDCKTVIGRHTTDPARWKRYKGGTAGDLWIDTEGKGEFNRLIKINGNITNPMYIGNRIYFISDYEGIGNIYSCNETGEDLQKHTEHKEFYVRNASSNGWQIVYHAGGDIYVYDVQRNTDKKIKIEFFSPRTQRNRKFADVPRYLESYDIHPKGHSVVLTARGSIFSMANWEGAVRDHQHPADVRYRIGRFLHDGERMVGITDEDGEETIRIFFNDVNKPSQKIAKLNIGKVINMKTSPKKDQIILSNHRGELLFIDLKSKASPKVIDKVVETADKITDFNWSPDGEWIVYSLPKSQHSTGLKLYEVKSGKKNEITDAVLHDVNPCFDPDGKYIYFLSYKVFDPVYDNMHFDLNFPRGVIPCLITLQKDTVSPFIQLPPPPEEEKKKDEKEDKNKKKADDKDVKIKIDLDGIKTRILTFPVPEGKYSQICGLKDKVIFSIFPIEGALKKKWYQDENEGKGRLDVYTFSDKKSDVLINGINDFKVSQDYSTLLYRAGKKMRVVKAGEKPDEKFSQSPPDKKSGWLDLNRLKLSVNPPEEWKQMYKDAWSLQKNHFWREDMCGIDWDKVYKRYLPLLDRISTRSEMSDILWEMQGELNTSHAYEMGGDYRLPPTYAQGLLGADFKYNAKKGGYVVAHIVKGDPGDEQNNSPFNAPGINIKEGYVLTAVNGIKLTQTLTPEEILINQAGYEVILTFSDKRTVTVKTLKTELSARYREWVNKNREYVNKATKGKVGYIHVPNMGALGYAEFHRSYLTEHEKEGLIVDVRYNGGGHVSHLLLEKLASKRIGYDVPRWGKAVPYPYEATFGAMVALTNEKAGSDGDIFSHSFKLMQLGKLIGKRTWGGVIGISPRFHLVDGTVTTQPEYSTWFQDVAYGVENYGTDPDIDIDITPQDYAKGKDPQMDCAIKEILDYLKKNPSKLPDFKKK